MRISYSSLEKFHTCERLFELDKLLIVGASNEETEHTTFGRAFGLGCQSYLIHGDSDRAIFEAFMEFNWDIETEKKNLPKLITALQNAFFKLDDIRQDYEIATFDGKPAVELSFRLNLDSEGIDYYVGFIDAVLRHRYDHTFHVLEIKHTGLQLLDLSPLYQNSGQTLGYSIVLDKIAEAVQHNYGVLYLVSQLDSRSFNSTTHVLPFKKTINDRLIWFLTLKMDYESICQMRQLRIFPRRGGSCLQYNRPCKHFGTCNLTALDHPAQEPEDTNVYQFVFSLDELIEEHLKILEGATA